MKIREYKENDITAMVYIWNKVVKKGSGAKYCLAVLAVICTDFSVLCQRVTDSFKAGNPQADFRFGGSRLSVFKIKRCRDA